MEAKLGGFLSFFPKKSPNMESKMVQVEPKVVQNLSLKLLKSQLWAA